MVKAMFGIFILFVSLLAIFTAFAGDLFVDKNDIRRTISSNEKMILRFQTKLEKLSHGARVEPQERGKLLDKIALLRDENQRLGLTLYGIKPEYIGTPLKQNSIEEESK